ncbi:MAG: insulinase family protein [Cellvibrionaceae bacterium]|nr:insulinase family protein [Cellvibrionaceae bacterium]
MSLISRSVLLLGLALPLMARAAFVLPSYERYTLSNGLEIILMRQDEVPLVNVVWAVKAGAVDDGAAQGLAATTLASLKLGAAGLSKQAIENTLANYGAELDTQANLESLQLSLSFMAEDSEPVLALLQKIIRQPSFPKAEFDKYRQRQISVAKQKRERPRAMMPDLFRQLRYGAHPYANSVSGNESSLAKLQRQQLLNFYQRKLSPDNSALIVVGDIDPQQWRKKLAAHFGSWQGQAQPAAVLAKPPLPAEPQVLLVDKADATETTFYIGGAGIAAADPDRTAVQVVNTLLGGRFTSWLNEALRTDSGLSYGARSHFSPLTQGGHFAISSYTKNETSFEAIDLALKTYQRLWQKGFDEPSLDSAKAYVKGRFPPRYETPGQLARLLAYLWVQGMGDDFINQFEARVDSLSPHSVDKLVADHFPRENLQFVLIGKADLLREGAKRYGRVREVDISTVNLPR